MVVVATRANIARKLYVLAIALKPYYKVAVCKVHVSVTLASGVKTALRRTVLLLLHLSLAHLHHLSSVATTATAKLTAPVPVTVDGQVQTAPFVSALTTAKATVNATVALVCVIAMTCGVAKTAALRPVLKGALVMVVA